ncbi:unnamed protein product [Linum trigynum]|uniref:Uncharacterized protein n=1 Tax=Linum trigynum TaxID=586398 RepID=A0AAV2GJS2_9ROSI
MNLAWNEPKKKKRKEEGGRNRISGYGWSVKTLSGTREFRCVSEFSLAPSILVFDSSFGSRSISWVGRFLLLRPPISHLLKVSLPTLNLSSSRFDFNLAVHICFDLMLGKGRLRVKRA